MNGKAAAKIQMVDKEKVKRVNKQVNKRFRRQDEWSFVPKFYIDGLKLVGSILLIPVVLCVALLEGVKAGFTAGLSKALTMYRGT